MPTPFESALLNLQLFDLRREAVLREARDWFLREFNPASFTDLVTSVSTWRRSSLRPDRGDNARAPSRGDACRCKGAWLRKAGSAT